MIDVLLCGLVEPAPDVLHRCTARWVQEAMCKDMSVQFGSGPHIFSLTD